jgi:DNA-binding MarR family transcriptional regulator
VSLLRRVSLTRREQRVVLAVLLSPTPPTASAVAKQTGLAYSHTKAVVRQLVARGILTRTPEGLHFQPLEERAG